MSNQNNKQCAGTYPVSGYVREDGTKVSGYMRTCGAKHARDGNFVDDAQNQTFSLSVEKNNLDKNIDDILFIVHNILDKGKDILKYLDLQRDIALYVRRDETYMKYYAISLDMENKKQFDTDNSYMEFKDIQNDKLKNFIRSECNIENLNDYTNVVISQYASPLNNSVVNSVELNNFIENNKIALQRGDFKDKHVDIVFNSTSDLSLTIGKAKLYNPQLDKYGNFSGMIVDPYDFSKLFYEFVKKTQQLIQDHDFLHYIKSLGVVFVNNNAYKQQLKGLLKPYILLVPIAKF